MSDDGQNELGKRFEDRVSPESLSPSASDSSNTPTARESINSDSASNSDNSDNPSNASSPGSDPDPNASRNRERIYMAVVSDRANALNGLYERFDARSKLAGQGGIEIHRDFLGSRSRVVGRSQRRTCRPA